MIGGVSSCSSCTSGLPQHTHWKRNSAWSSIQTLRPAGLVQAKSAACTAPEVQAPACAFVAPMQPYVANSTSGCNAHTGIRGQPRHASGPLPRRVGAHQHHLALQVGLGEVPHRLLSCLGHHSPAAPGAGGGARGLQAALEGGQARAPHAGQLLPGHACRPDSRPCLLGPQLGTGNGPSLHAHHLARHGSL